MAKQAHDPGVKKRRARELAKADRRTPKSDHSTTETEKD